MGGLKLNKENWIKVRLGDIAEEPKEKTKDILGDGFEHIVGLEHIESENIHLTESFPADSETSFSKVFRKGDILFGRRRAYLKKAVQASFDGVCSGDITVIRAKEDKINPDLLPFVIHNDKFFDYAVKHSAGGLSPRVKYKDLANYEFLLPPKEEQAALAELLWAMDEVIEKDKELLGRVETLFKVKINELTSFENDYCKNVKNIGDLGDTVTGLSGKTKKDFGAGKPFIPYLNIYQNFQINPKQMDYVNIKEGENQNVVKYGDILFTGSSETPDEVGISSVVLDDLGECYFNSFCFGFRLNNFDDLLPEYAKFLFRGKDVRKFMNTRAQGATRFNLSKNDLKKFLNIKLPDIETQETIARELNRIEKSLMKIKPKFASSQSLQRSLINEVF